MNPVSLVPSAIYSTPHPPHPIPASRRWRSTKKGIRAFPILPWLLTTICPLRGLSLPLTQLMLFSHGNQPAVAAATTVSAAITTAACRGARNCGGFLEEKTSLWAQKQLPHSHTNTQAHTISAGTHMHMHAHIDHLTKSMCASSHRQTHSLNHKGKHETCCLQPQGHGSNVRQCMAVNEKKLAQWSRQRILGEQSS